MIKDPPCNAGDVGLIPGQGTEIPHAQEQLSPCTGTTEAQLASIRQMSRQVSRSSAGEYQADEKAGVARVSCRL